MISSHDVAGVRFGVEWREAIPNVWKINALRKTVPSASVTLPSALAKRFADITTAFRSSADGTIPRLPLDLFDRDGVELTGTRQDGLLIKTGDIKHVMLNLS
jgi:hypothetical protein